MNVIAAVAGIQQLGDLNVVDEVPHFAAVLTIERVKGQRQIGDQVVVVSCQCLLADEREGHIVWQPEDLANPIVLVQGGEMVGTTVDVSVVDVGVEMRLIRLRHEQPSGNH